MKTSARRALGPTWLRIKNASLRNPRVGAALPCRPWNLDWSVFETRLLVWASVFCLTTAVALAEPVTIEITPERADLKFGLNRPQIARSADGQKLVAKSNLSKDVTPELALARDRNGVLASQILKRFGLNVVASFEAKWLDAKGNWVYGTAAPWIDNARTLIEFPASRISNPDEAVALVIWREFVGDVDANATNYLVHLDSKVLVGIDFDKALAPEIFAIKSSAFRDIMRLYATPARVEPVLQRIARLGSVDLEKLIDELGPAHVSSWSPELREKTLKALRHNRDALSEGNPYFEFYGQSGTWFVPSQEQIKESKGDSRVRD